MAIGPGSVVAGKYRVESELGSGGMGMVVSVMHLELDERRAIKILHAQFIGHPEISERFTREARALVRLKSEHVTRVHDVGKLDTGEPYIVMEHLDGTDLGKHLRDRKRLPVDEAIEIVCQVSTGLEEAHGLGIIHRDLKSGNVFVSPAANGRIHVKVLDFGISKIVDPTGKAADLTTSSEVLGSPSYMAPEQVRGLKNADVRTDIWALGVILYELCTGQRPFRKTKTADVMTLVLTSLPMRPGLLRGDMPTGLEALIMRCLEKDPGKRFQTVRELHDELLAIRAAAAATSAVPQSAPIPATTEAVEAPPRDARFPIAAEPAPPAIQAPHQATPHQATPHQATEPPAPPLNEATVSSQTTSPWTAPSSPSEPVAEAASSAASRAPPSNRAAVIVAFAGLIVALLLYAVLRFGAPPESASVPPPPGGVPSMSAPSPSAAPGDAAPAGQVAPSATASAAPAPTASTTADAGAPFHTGGHAGGDAGSDAGSAKPGPTSTSPSRDAPVTGTGGKKPNPEPLWGNGPD